MIEFECMPRSALYTDLDQIVGLRDDLASWMVRSGIAQWRPGEYAQEHVARQIEGGEWHVIEHDGALIASVRLARTDPVLWPDGREAGYIHGLMVSRSHAGQGLGSWLLGWAENVARQSQLTLARLDCVASNTVLGDFYRRHGYREAGIVDFGPESHRHATMRFEKALE